MIRKDYTSKRFGKLIVLKFLRRDAKNTWWLVKCECGTEKEMLASGFKNPNNIGCGCSRILRGPESANWKGAGNLGKSFLSRIKSHAKVRGIIVSSDLDIAYLWSLLEKQNHKCALTGLPIDVSMHGNQYYYSGTASLDRIDSSKGYTPGNVQWVYKDVNFMKQQLSMDRFYELCRLVVSYKGE